MRPARARLVLLATLAAAALLRLVALLDLRANDPLFPTRQTFSDGRYYHEWASALAAGREFPPEPAGSPHWMPPLFPWALSLLYRVSGPDPLALVLVQHALGLLGLLLLHRLGSRAFGEGPALLAAALGALYLPPAFFEGKPMAETMAVFLSVAALLVLSDVGSRPRLRALNGGLLLGLAACARPQLLLAIPAVALAFARKPLRAALVPFLAGGVLAPGATLVRNLAVSGQPVLVSANGGVNFHFGNHPGVRGTFHAPGPQWGSIFEQRATALREASRAVGRPVDESAASAHFYGRGLEWMAANPRDAAKTWIRKAGHLVSNEEIEIVYSPAAESTLAKSLRLFFVPFALLLGLAAAGFLAPARDATARRTLLLFLAAGAAAQIAFFSYSRFRLLLLPALLPLAGAGGAALVDLVRSRRGLGTRAAAALAAVLSLLASREEGLHANALVDVGNAWRDERNPAEAERAYRRSIEVRPNARAQLTLAQLLEATGRAREAEVELRRAAGSSAEARYRLGVLYLDPPDPSLRRPEEARRIFEELLREDPAHYEARCGLANYRLVRGETDLARGEFDRASADAPDRPEAWNGLASCFEAQGRAMDAAAARARAAAARR